MLFRSGRRGYLASLSSVACLLAILTVGGCSPLDAYNTLIVKDDGAVLAASNVAYGSHPRQKVDVYVPTARVDSAPVVLVLYGGSWNSGRKEDYSFLGKALSSQGFVTVVADYRLVPEVRFPAFLHDSAAESDAKRTVNTTQAVQQYDEAGQLVMTAS